MRLNLRVAYSVLLPDNFPCCKGVASDSSLFVISEDGIDTIRYNQQKMCFVGATRIALVGLRSPSLLL